MGLTTLFLDMNSYFASVEQQVHPAFRGRPVAVVPMMADTTVCVAASYEAKRFGVRTGTRVDEAKRMCPGLILINGKHELYIQMHHQIVEAVNTCLPVEAVHSVDEMSCRLLGKEREPERALELARDVKMAIYRDVGEYLRCSVGLASNGFLAKVATEIEKPDGLVMLQESDLPERLYGLELTDLPGIGRRMLVRLQRHGIDTVEQLCAASEEKLVEVWQSVIGHMWWHWLRGRELPEKPTHHRTVGHSHVLPPMERTEDGARAVLVRLIHKAAVRLRNMDYWARRMHVSVRSLDRTSWSVDVSLGMCRDTTTMLEAFARMWRERQPLEVGVPIKVSMRLYGLVENRFAPGPLFPAERKRLRLIEAVDALNLKYGRYTVYFASMHRTRDSVPVRIAFGHIPDLDRPT